MARKKLTDLFVRNVQPPKAGRDEYFDTHTTGLVLRVTARGVKSWSVYDRLTSGEKFRQTIGAYPAVRLADAHKAAADAIAQVREGKDPRQVKAAAKAVEAGRRADTVEAIAAEFITDHASTKRWGEFERVLNVTVIPKWGRRPVTDITRRDVRDLVRDVRTHGARGRPAPVQGNRTITVLRVFFRWAAKNDYVPGDPTAGVDKTEEKSRTRKFSDDEVRAFWRGCDRLGWPFGPIFQLLLLFGARKSEVAKSHWNEIDIGNRCVMEIPGERTKNKQMHVIPLSRAAITIIKALKKIGETPDLVFTTNLRTAVSGFSKAKRELDILMECALRDEMTDAQSRATAEPLLTPWKIHDLRRVVHSGLGALGVSLDVRERILGHALVGIRKVYDAHEYIDEKRAALDRWASHVAGIVNPPPVGNVVALRKRRRS